VQLTPQIRYFDITAKSIFVNKKALHPASLSPWTNSKQKPAQAGFKILFLFYFSV